MVGDSLLYHVDVESGYVWAHWCLVEETLNSQRVEHDCGVVDMAGDGEDANIPS